MEEIQLTKNRQSGRVASAVVTAILVFFFVYNLLSKQNPPPEPLGIEIQFGAEDMGQNDDSNPYAEENNLEEFVEETPDEVVEEVADVSEPEPSNQDVVTDDSQPAVTPPKKETKKPKEPKPTKTPKPKETKPTKPTKTTGSKPKSPKATFPGSKTGTGGNGTGSNGKTGPQGGDGQGTSTTGGTVGSDIGGGLSGRPVKKRVKPKNNTGRYGTVVITICVNKDGKVVSAEYTQKGSTTADGKLRALSESAAKQYRFEAAPYAPDKQCGNVTFKFRPG